MTWATRGIAIIGFAAGALLATGAERLHAQSSDPNGAPNPYKVEDNWLKLPPGRKMGQAIKVQVDHSDGKSIWVFDRCESNECTNSSVAPIQKFDSSGAFQTAIGAGKFAVPHGLFADYDGSVWAGDQIAKNGKGAVMIRFNNDRIMKTFGRPGMPGDADGFLSAVSAIVVSYLGRIYVADGHGAGTNDRIMEFDATGTLRRTWGKHGKGPGEFDTPHGIALDSQGRVYVADRSNNRIQIFTPDGQFIAEWKQFGRPSDVAIGKDDMIYVADSQSDEKTNPGFKQGIRIGSVKDGKVTAFIPAVSPEIGSPEGVGVDDAGNVYASWVAKTAVRRFVK